MLVLACIALRRVRQVSTLPSFILAPSTPITVIVPLLFLAPAPSLPIIKQPIVMLLVVMVLQLLLLVLPSIIPFSSTLSSTTFSFLQSRHGSLLFLSLFDSDDTAVVLLPLLLVLLLVSLPACEGGGEGGKTLPQHAIGPVACESVCVQNSKRTYEASWSNQNLKKRPVPQCKGM